MVPCPLIFLDIDGVICCNTQARLDEPQLAQLKRVCKATGAKIVLSSDWRRRVPLKQKVQRALKRMGVEYVGCTPIKTETTRIGSQLIETNLRPAEILSWLEKRGGRSPRAWVAIDDRDLLAEALEHGDVGFDGHFVRTDIYTGLTPELAELAIEILSRTPTADDVALVQQLTNRRLESSRSEGERSFAGASDASSPTLAASLGGASLRTIPDDDESEYAA